MKTRNSRDDNNKVYNVNGKCNMGPETRDQEIDHNRTWAASSVGLWQMRSGFIITETVPAISSGHSTWDRFHVWCQIAVWFHTISRWDVDGWVISTIIVEFGRSWWYQVGIYFHTFRQIMKEVQQNTKLYSMNMFRLVVAWSCLSGPICCLHDAVTALYFSLTTVDKWHHQVSRSLIYIGVQRAWAYQAAAPGIKRISLFIVPPNSHNESVK